jgi:hypothetical protein
MAEAVEQAGADVQVWLSHISAYEREFKKWEGRNQKIIERYRDEKRKTADSLAKFNILWSNVQTLVPATFARLPQPDVSRRFKDNDPIGRVASLIIERALEFEIQNYPDYRQSLKATVYDRFLGGRGTAWARYEPHIRAVQMGEPEDGLTVTEDVDEPQEELDYECAPVDYVHWRDFGHTVARTWEEVTGVWRKVYMTREACIERFGEELGNTIPLDSRPEDLKKGETLTNDQYARALIYEIWNKEDKRALWLSKSLGKFVDEKDDPLGVEGFFPCPRPLFATLTNDSLVPVPDFTLYQDQANELDTLAERISGLINALKVRGVYNAEFTELQRLFTEGENNTLIPIKNFAAFAEKEGLKGAIDLVDLAPIAAALLAAYQAMEQVKQQIYDITGLADIVRGQTDAGETATAQQIKGQYASMRLNSMKHDVAQFATEVLQLKAQIMCGKFDPETLLKISAADQLSDADKQMIPQALEMLKSNPMRSFRIEIAADSLVQMDEEQEKKDRMEMLQALGGYLKEALPVIQGAPEVAPMLIELMKFAVGAFKVGKGVEGMIDETMDKVKAGIEAKAGQPKPPDPEMVKVQAKQQADQAKLQADQQAEMARAQADMAIERAKMQMQNDMERQRMGMEMQFEQQRLEMERVAQERQAQVDMQMEQMRMALEQFKAIKQAETAITVAEIGAEATLTAQQESAADDAAKD